MRNIKRYHQVIDNSLFMTTGSLDYDRVTDAIIKLATYIEDFEGDTESIWYIGEFTSACVSELIVGAFWHYTEWHDGMYSKGYRALSALGGVFDPGMTMPENDNEAFIALERMASEANQ